MSVYVGCTISRKPCVIQQKHASSILSLFHNSSDYAASMQSILISQLPYESMTKRFLCFEYLFLQIKLLITYDVYQNYFVTHPIVFCALVIYIGLSELSPITL